jgi:hypothetical protein
MGVQFLELDSENKKTLESMLRTQQAVVASRLGGGSLAALPAVSPADAAVEQWLRSIRPAGRTWTRARWIATAAFIAAGIAVGWMARDILLSPSKLGPTSPRPISMEPAAAAAARQEPPLPAPQRLEYDGGR